MIIFLELTALGRVVSFEAFYACMYNYIIHYNYSRPDITCEVHRALKPNYLSILYNYMYRPTKCCFRIQTVQVGQLLRCVILPFDPSWCHHSGLLRSRFSCP